MNFRTIVITSLCLSLPTLTAFAQLQTFCIKAVVTEIEDQENVFNNSVQTGDTIEGTIKYYLDILDNNAMAQVGDYSNDSVPAGIVLHLNGQEFRTDSTDIDFLVETVNNYNSLDNIVFHSYKNVYPAAFAVLTDTHIGWQLDDPTQTALPSTALPTSINLSNWQQPFGLTIDGSSLDLNTSVMIRATVAHVDNCGTDTLSSGTNEPHLSAGYRLFPNPTSDAFTVGANRCLEGELYYITDALGRIVKRGLLKGCQAAVEMMSCGAGLYTFNAGGIHRRVLVLTR
jgi:hypothetical protein